MNTVNDDWRPQPRRNAADDLSKPVDGPARKHEQRLGGRASPDAQAPRDARQPGAAERHAMREPTGTMPSDARAKHEPARRPRGEPQSKPNPSRAQQAQALEPVPSDGAAWRRPLRVRAGGDQPSAGPRMIAATAARHVLRVVLLGVVPLIAALIGMNWYAHGGRDVETDNAYVKAHIMAISAEVSGKVVEVFARDNAAVSAGAPLFRLDPAPFELAATKAKAQMEVVRTEVRSLRAEYRATLMEGQEARQRIGFLNRQIERQGRLRELGMMRADQFDETQLDLAATRRRVASIEERANRVLANLAGDPQLPEEQHPKYLEAKTALDAAQMDLTRTLVSAPVAGVVSNLKLRVGEYVAKGAPAFSLIEAGPVWVEANYKETQLTFMRTGQRAQIIADAYPDRPLSAIVSAIAPATGAEFAVLPPQNATGNWVKVVQRIPVLLQVQSDAGQPQLRAGMTVTVSVDTGHERGLPHPIKRLVDAGWLPSFLSDSHLLARDER